MRDCGFQMETAGYGNSDHFITVRLSNLSQLPNSFFIGARRKTSKKLSADSQNVAAFDGSRESDVFYFSKTRNRFCKRSSFPPPRFRPERKNHRKFIEHNRGIFNKHGIRKFGFGRQGDYVCAERGQRVFIRVMLFAGALHVDWNALDEAQLAAGESGAYGTSDGG